MWRSVCVGVRGLTLTALLLQAAGTDPILSTQCDRPLKTWNMQEVSSMP